MSDAPYVYPFTTFNFAVDLLIQGSGDALCRSSFAECDGLEMSLDVKTIREGGNNGTQIRLVGPSTYGQLTLKRGMTSSFDLWNWFERVIRTPSVRAVGEVMILAADGVTPCASFLLDRCIPLKIKVPALNAKDGMVAIEEMQLGYEALRLRPLEGATRG
jgi:phage tail-like protein